MRSLYLPEGVSLKSYKANVVGAKATIDVRFESKGHHALNWLLEQLDEVEGAQRAARNEPPVPKKDAP
jgi:hypothetical protein